MHRASRRMLFVVLSLVLISATSLAQYKRVKLVTNLATGAKHSDPQLVNAWGVAYAPGSPFWVSDEGTGLSTLYDALGNKQSLIVTIPTFSGSGVGSPTGMVYNGSTEFKIMTWTSAFMFATLDGTISGWSHFSPNAALIGAKHSGAMYNGLAITSYPSGNHIYATDIAHGKVDMYDGTFTLIKSFTDTNLPPNFVPSGIQDINGQLYIAFVDVNGGTGGFIDIFKEDGTFVKTLISGAPLNQPWGIAMAPSNFGVLSNTLLVGNNIDKAGTINGFDPNTGAFVGTIRNKLGNPIKIDQLWAIKFGGGGGSGSNGNTNQLFWTAGPKANLNGLFGVIQAIP
jgi:uncharacterized protein (TIGR03118 family)